MNNLKMDFNIICRFCMAKDGPMHNIFEDFALKAKANALLPNLKIFVGDSLPRHICKHCIYQLNAAYKFKRKCEDTYVVLQQHIESKIPGTNIRNTNDQEEIQIDSEEEAEVVGNITEPLVVLSSNTSSDDQDPLDLGRTENQSLYTDSSCENNGSEKSEMPLEENLKNSNSSWHETSEYPDENTDSKWENSSNFPKEHVNAKWQENSFNVPNSFKTEDDSMNVEGSNGIDPNQQAEESQSIKCSEMGQSEIDMSMTDSNITIPEHFLNETCEETPNKQCLEKFRCPICGLPFVSRYRLDLHLGDHDGETPYVCHLCKKGFAREGGLKAHLKLHSGEKPHVCTVCNKAFSLKGNLKVHLRLHTGEKPFQCPTCKKAFTQKISLTKHLSVHKAAL